jgi:hypothetical protein
MKRMAWGGRHQKRSAVAQAVLAVTGVLLALYTFFTVLNMPDLLYHPARDAELRATYETYQGTGVLLVKQNGTGSWYGAVEGEGLTRAAGDDDPGSYLVASLMGRLTDSDSPYPGLRWAMAVATALPMLLLPFFVARLFRRVSAGAAMLALPAVTYLTNHRAMATGTEYGLSNHTSSTPVYALYGMPAAVVFATLVLVGYFATRRLGLRGLLAVTVVVVLLASFSNLLRSMSGVGAAAAVAVVWWVSLRPRWTRWATTAASAAVLGVAVLASLTVPGVVMQQLDGARAEVVMAESSKMTESHGVWHNPYIGLSYPTPITGEPSPFGVVWSDEWGWQRALEVDPTVRPGSARYDAIIKDLYLAELREAPVKAARLFAAKAFYTMKHFWAMLALIALGLGLVALRAKGALPTLIGMAALALPTLAIGLLPPVIVMPMLYYFTELVAGLAFLSAVALGGLVWVAASWSTSRTESEDAEDAVAPDPARSASQV